MKFGFDNTCIWVVLTLVGLILVNFALMFYLAYFRMKQVLEYLKNSPAVMNSSMRSDRSPTGRLSFLGYVSMMLTMPGHSINKGLLDAQDYDRFPQRLKLIVKLCNCFIWLSSALLVVMYFLCHGSM